tara:strand:- start:12336 stop:12869 length:534 start_codon:yes stop_codon:yes gene_type:complete
MKLLEVIFSMLVGAILTALVLFAFSSFNQRLDKISEDVVSASQDGESCYLEGIKSLTLENEELKAEIEKLKNKNEELHRYLVNLKNYYDLEMDKLKQENKGLRDKLAEANKMSSLYLNKYNSCASRPPVIQKETKIIEKVVERKASPEPRLKAPEPKAQEVPKKERQDVILEVWEEK